jgi:hypothetical protein
MNVVFVFGVLRFKRDGGGGGRKFPVGSPGKRTMFPSDSIAVRRRRKFHEHEVVKSKLLLKMKNE